jgi:hypothetical protein
MVHGTGKSERARPLALAATLVLCGAGALEAQAPPPGSYVLTNARVVVSPERTLEGATVVVRDGRIAAVGEGLAAPGDARILDLRGLTIYPGLIDAASTANRPPAPATDAPGASNLAPGRRALDGLELPDAARDAWRAAGVTTLGLAYAGGTDLRRAPGPQYRIEQEAQPLLPGHTSLVSLGAGPLEQLVVRAPGAVQVGFGTRTVHQYPVTLMGSIAFVHQAFLDAAHQRRLRAGNVRGAEPVFRPEVEPLEAAAGGDQQVWFTAWQENNIKRAIGLGEELGLDYALLGAQEGFRVVDRIARTGRPVLVSLAYPPPQRATGRSYALDVFGASGAFGSPEQVDAATARAFRGNAAALVAAGVPVALTSYGLEGPEQFRAAVLEAVQAGLPTSEALRALTVTPARILGLADRIGTVEAGKAANLLVVDGDLFAAGASIRHVFVDGRLFDVTTPAAGRRAERETDLPAVRRRG